MKKYLFIFSISVIFIHSTTRLHGQNANIEVRINNGELKMSFPSIYFKHNSTDYAKMPYTVDSCFKYIATYLKDINSKPIWRDSSETEQLTNERIKKLKADLAKYLGSKKIKIQSMRKEQKISQRTIYNGTDSTQIQYLLSLNSVFDISRTRIPNKIPQSTHGLWLFGTCWKCIITEPFRHPGYFTNKRKREQCRMERRHEQTQIKQ